MCRYSRRLSVILACAIGLVPLLAGAADPKPLASKIEYYKGKVVPLADLVAQSGSRLDADAATPDRRLKGTALERQRPRARERAEQHRADYAAGRFGERRHVERVERFGGTAAAFEQRRLVDPAVRHGGALGHREHPVG